MPKPNYAFEKRQRELEAKRKKADKAARKASPSPLPETGAEPSRRDDPPPAATSADAAA